MILMLTKLSLEGKVESFDGNAREVKGKLIRFDQLYTQISVIPFMCSLGGWKCRKKWSCDGIDELKRALLLLESMEVELAAEGMRLESGEKSGEINLCVDERWGQSLYKRLNLILLINRDSDQEVSPNSCLCGPFPRRNLVPITLVYKI